MRNSESEVFANFVKIAKEKGLVSDKEPEHTEKNTKSPRWDSQDISTIEALYGVKPDLPKGMEYEHNIMENAHPNSAVVSPAYDRLNGLVENNIERQNILMHILYKQPEIGTPNQFRYPPKPKLLWQTADPTKLAQKDLLLTLVRIGNDMDNNDKDELRILADTCLAQIHKEAAPVESRLGGFMGGFLGTTGLWIAGAAAALGLVYAINHLDNMDRGLTENYNRLQEALSVFINSSVSWGFGHEYDAQLKEDVTSLKDRLTKFWDTYQKITPLLRAMERPKDQQDLIKISQDPKVMAAVKLHKELLDEVTSLGVYLAKIKETFNNIDYKASHTTQKGGITSLIDSIPFLHGGKGTEFADDFDTVVNAIGPFNESVERLVKSLKDSETFAESAKRDLDQLHAKTQSELGVTTPGPLGDAELEAEKKQHAELGQDLGEYAKRQT